MTEIIELKTRRKAGAAVEKAEDFLRKTATAIEGKGFAKVMIYYENDDKACLSFSNYGNTELLWVAEQIRQWVTR